MPEGPSGPSCLPRSRRALLAAALLAAPALLPRWAIGDNDKMPIPLYRGDVDAILAFEPYAALAVVNGWGSTPWTPCDTPMGRTNLGFVAPQAFVAREPDLTRLVVQAHKTATRRIIDDPAVALQTTMRQFNMPRPVAERSNADLFFSHDSGEAFQAGLPRPRDARAPAFGALCRELDGLVVA